jgi:CHAD domain-containing protein
VSKSAVSRAVPKENSAETGQADEPPAEKPAWQRELDEMEREDVQAWHSALAMLRLVNAQRPVPALFADRYTRIDYTIAKEIDRAADWINEFRRVFHGPDDQHRRA